MRTVAMYLSDAPYWAKPPRDGQWAKRKQLAINVISDGITRLPVLEGEVSHIEVPRLSSYLGMTIVGGADTALRCIVVQEVYPEGLIGQDGRLRPGDQLVEINGADMTNTSHYQACQTLRKITPVLRLGVYREKVEVFRSSGNYIEEIHSAHLKRTANKPIGVRICDSLLDEPALFVAEVMEEAVLKHIRPYDRILSINGQDASEVSAQLANRYIQDSDFVTLVVSRKRLDTEESSKRKMIEIKEKPTSQKDADVLQKRNKPMNSVCHTDGLTTSTHQFTPSHSVLHEIKKISHSPLTKNPLRIDNDSIATSKKTFKIEETNLQHRSVVIIKNANESLGMRIGGGMGSSEGDIPIYIANIHPQGCVGRTQEILKGDILLSVCETSLIGLTHSQAVATLKATVPLSQVTLTVFEGPETSLGSLNFIPSWLYWQNLPRCLQYAKTVVLHRSARESLGFSIVGGEDPIRGPEPIHVLYVVQDSPASEDGKLRSGDRLLAVDGRSLEGVKHSTAVAMLKQTGSKVTLQVVSWMGTEV